MTSLRADRRRLPRPPRAVFPHAEERGYERALLVYPRTAGVIAAKHLRPVLDALPRTDAEAETLNLGAIFKGMRLEYERRFDERDARRVAFKTAGRIDAHVAAQTYRQAKVVLGIDVLRTRIPPALVESFVVENVNLIKSIPFEFFGQIETLVRESVSEGRRAKTLAREIQERTGVASSRAMLIARDQIGKLNGQVTQERQTALGVVEYVWRTSGDERVRDEHRELDGRRFSWDDPPDEGHPGSGIQCRCLAEPVMDGVLG